MVLKPDPVGLEIQHQPLSRDALHEISTEFLASDKLAHAPLAEKKDFLKTKGLSEDEIESLLQRAVAKGKGKEVVAADSEEASASRISTPASCDAETTTEERVENNEEKGLVPKELKEVSQIISLYPLSLKPPPLTPIADSPLPTTLSKAQTHPYRAHSPPTTAHRNIPRIPRPSTATPRPHHRQIAPKHPLLLRRCCFDNLRRLKVHPSTHVRPAN